MKRYTGEAVQARVRVQVGEQLRTRYYLAQGEATDIVVERGEAWTPLACKEVYGKAVKTALSLKLDSCAFDLTEAAKLGRAGICAAVEGIYGGAYKQKDCMTGRVEPELACYAEGEGWSDGDLAEAVELARSVMAARNLVNLPGNMLPPEKFAQALVEAVKDLPVEARVYHREELKALGLNVFLSVGDSSGNPPCMAVLRYTGAPDSGERLCYVGKGVTIDTGGYCLKPPKSMVGMKGDMAGGAAAAMAVRALAAAGAGVNVTAVVPMAENRISRDSSLPGDVVTSLSGLTVENLNTDAEGRLLLCDALTWAVRQEGATRLVDIATLTGAIYAMLGHVATGVMASDDGWYGQLETAAGVSGEKFWRMPDFPEYEKLIESDLADVRNTSKDGCGAITAGLFLKKFTQGLPWLHLDIAGTADGSSPLYQHHVGGATGAGTATLYHLARTMEA